MSKYSFPDPEDGIEDEWLSILEGVIDSIKQSKIQIPSGSHSTCNEGILNVMNMMDIKEGEVLWDIGVGNPKLAFFYSMISKTTVVGTDIGK